MGVDTIKAYVSWCEAHNFKASSGKSVEMYQVYQKGLA